MHLIFFYNAPTQGTRIKILTPKQMLQRLPVALAHVKVDSTFKNLQNETRQNRYSLNRGN